LLLLEEGKGRGEKTPKGRYLSEGGRVERVEREEKKKQILCYFWEF